jgi:hypothetical protein
MKIAIIVTVVLFSLLVLPLLIIWSLNNIFKLGIAYNVSDWFSILVLLTILNAIFKASVTPSKKDK